MEKFNPYKILNVSSNASIDEISKAYKKLAIKYHPDKNKDNDAHDIFVNIKKAYEILSDPKKKSKYDKYGVCDDNELQENSQEIIKEMIMKNRLKQIIKLNIDIIDLIKGTKKIINFNREILNNSRIAKTEPCKIELDLNLYTPINKPIIINGMGKEINDIRGDLYILLRIKFSNNYTIKDNCNMIYNHTLTLAESLCGMKFILPYYNIELYYDDIINNKYIYKIPNRGLTIEENNINKQTDLEIVFNIIYPKLSLEQTKKLKEILDYNEYSKYINNDLPSIKLNIQQKSCDIENNYYETPNVQNDSDSDFGFPGFHHFEFPGFSSFPGMNAFDFSTRNFNTNERVHVQECQTQ